MYENPYQAPQILTPAEMEASDYAANAHRPRIWTAFAALVTAFSASIAVSIVIGITWAIVLIQSGASLTDMEEKIAAIVEDPLGFILLTAVGQIPFLVTPLIAAWMSPVPFRRRLGLVPSGLSGLEVVVVVLGAAVPFGLGLAFSYGLAELIEPDSTTERLYDNMTWATAIAFIAFIALVPAFSEELLFRGFMQRRLLERWPRWAAILFSSLCFALVHMEPHTVVFAFPLGIWLGWVAWKTNSIWPCIATHAAVNGGWNIVVCGMRLTGVEEWPLVPIVVAAVLGVGATIWAVLILRSRGEQPLDDRAPSYSATN